MKGTCNFKDCFFADLLEKQEQCPNFIQTWWTPKDGAPILLDDCAPRRLVLMLMSQDGRLTGLQKAHEQQRNATEELVTQMLQVCELASKAEGKLSISIKGDEVLNGLGTKAIEPPKGS